MTGPVCPLPPWRMGGAFSVHQDGDAKVENGGNPQQISVADIDFAALDALEIAPADPGGLAQGLLGVVRRGP